MAQIEYRRIILRSGPAADLPGEPISLSPLQFGDGLEKGELAFLEDTGRLYIGHDPIVGQPQFNRIGFPYRNIEVLTENSTDTLSTMVGSALKDENEDSFHYSTLVVHATDWEKVIVPRSSEPNYTYRLEYSDNASAKIEYTIFAADNQSVKSGTITVRYFDGEAEPTMIEECSCKRRLDLTEPDASDPVLVYQYVDFQFVVDGPINGRYLSFEYKNHTDDALQLRFKTSRPKV